MNITYRIAEPDDAATCIVLRGETRENAFSIAALAELGITQDSWRAAICDGSLPGHVAIEQGAIVGYCFGDRNSGEILVLALLPDYEGRGIGKQLLDLMVAELSHYGFKRLFLGCSAEPSSRSYGFYRHLGWRPTGAIDELNDEVLEYFPVSADHRE